MSRTIEQIRGILHGSPRWNAGLQWYDFLLAIAFNQDGTGEMIYGGGQAIRCDIKFHYEVSADMQIYFEFFDTFDDYWGKMFERTEKNAFKTVAFRLLDGPFVIDEPYNHEHSYRYLLRFASDPFPESEGPEGGPPDASLRDYYSWQIT